MKTKYLTHTVLFISMAALTPVALAQSDATGKSAAEEKTTVLPGSLTTVIAGSATFSTLTKALKATGLDTTLGNKEEFTVFAPTDEAFAKLPAGTLTKLMLPENSEKLRMLLLYHVVAGKVLAADLTSGDVKTVNGEKLKVDVSTDKIEVDGAKVYSADVRPFAKNNFRNPDKRLVRLFESLQTGESLVRTSFPIPTPARSKSLSRRWIAVLTTRPSGA